MQAWWHASKAAGKTLSVGEQLQPRVADIFGLDDHKDEMSPQK